MKDSQNSLKQQTEQLEFERLKEELRTQKVSRWTKPLSVMAPILVLAVTGLLNFDYARLQIKNDRLEQQIERSAFQQETKVFERQKDSLKMQEGRLNSNRDRLKEEQLKNNADQAKLDSRRNWLKQAKDSLDIQRKSIDAGKDELSIKIKALLKAIKIEEERENRLVNENQALSDSIKATERKNKMVNQQLNEKKVLLVKEFAIVKRSALEVVYQDLFNEAGRAYLSTSKLIKLVPGSVDKDILLNKQEIPKHIDKYLKEIDLRQQEFQLPDHYLNRWRYLYTSMKEFAVDVQNRTGSEKSRIRTVFKVFAPEITALRKATRQLQLKPEYANMIVADSIQLR